ncbi:MAG: cadherin domain-containing protein [Reichenbachiella sp.]
MHTYKITSNICVIITAFFLTSCSEDEGPCPIISTEDFTFTILENTSNGTSIGDISLVSPDNTTLTYTLVSGDSDGTFIINDNGILTVNDQGNLDFEQISEFVLTIEVSSICDTDTYQVTIRLQDQTGCFERSETGLLTNRTINIDGVQRAYDVYIPTSVNCSQRVPLVIDMHGFTLDKETQRAISDFDILAEREQFIVIFPQGLPNSNGNFYWNDNEDNGSDDISFLSQLIEDSKTNLNIDPKKVYLSGFSDGGFMAYTMACEIGPQIAAIASVTGSMRFAEIDACDPIRKVPIIQFHGTNDQVVPFSWNDAVIDYWINFNGCIDNPSETPYPDTDPNDDTTAIRFTWDQCDFDSEFIFIVIENGSHSWPGSERFFESNISGTNNDINATKLIWEFFQQHTL